MLIKADWDGARVRLTPGAFLGGALFELYRRAAAPAVYSPVYRCQTCTVDQYEEAEEGLSIAGFAVQRSARLAAVLGALEHERELEREAVDARLDRIDQDLKTRGLALFAYQREGARFLALRQNALLADDMGLGKTVQILAALPERARVLIVCPAVVRSVWMGEVARFRPDLRVRTIQSRDEAAARSLVPSEGELVAVSYDLLPEAGVSLENCILVADEAHALKGSKSLRSQRFRRLAETASRVWLATATPIANRLEEAWHLLTAGRMHLEAFGSWERFLRMAGAKKGRFGLIWPGASKVSDEMREGLDKVMLRRTKVEVLPQLPEKRIRVIGVDINETLSRACDEMLEELEDLGEDLLDESLEDALPFERLAELRRKLAVAKYPALEDLVVDYEAQSEPLVVFSAHRFAVDKLGSREGWRVITGDERDEDRAEAVRLFQAGELRGIALTIKAGGVGLTLTRGAHAVFLDASYVPAENSQAEDRILRLGQTRGVLVTRLVARHPIDERVQEILRHKTDVIDVVLNKKNNRRVRKEKAS